MKKANSWMLATVVAVGATPAFAAEDGFFVNGSARMVGAASAALRLIQSGYMYLYAFAMILGVFIALFWWVVLRAV